MTLERNVNLSKMNNDTWQEAIWLAHRTEAWLLVNFHSISAIFQVNTFLLSSRENGDILANFFSLSGTEGWKKNPRHFTDSNSATRRIFYEKSIGGRVYVSPFQKFSSPHTSPFESSSSVPTYSRTLFGNEYFSSRTSMGLESVYNSLFTDSFKMTGTLPWLRRKRERQTQQGFMRQTTTLHVHRAFLYISSPSLHDYDVKIPNFAFKLEAGRLLFF